MKVRIASLFVLALVSCGDDASPEDAPPERDASARDASARDASARDASARDASRAAEDDAGADGEERDAAVHDAGRTDAGARDAGDTAKPDASTPASGESGRMVGMTAAHNKVRAMVETTMSLPSMTWSSELAAYAQEWADHLAQTACASPMHRSPTDLQAKKYGENLAYYYTTAGGKLNDTAQTAVDGWANEVACYTYGPLMDGDACNVSCYTAMKSDGCGHYTQIVWRNSTEVGCGVATCTASGRTADIWICNYSPPGNVKYQKPY